MADEENKNLNPTDGTNPVEPSAENPSEIKPDAESAPDVKSDAAEAADSAQSADGSPVEEKGGKGGKGKKKKGDKSDDDADKQVSRYKKEWEDSLVASKRVKREEKRRKWKKTLLLLLVMSLVITSVVYIMLLFIEQNNIRITVSNSDDKTISLSFDREHWSPYLDVNGPTEMSDVSYNLVYGEKHVDIPTLSEMANIVTALADGTNPGGDWSKQDVIEFSFFIENSCSQTVPIYYEMSLECDDRGLQNCIRVVWGESYGVSRSSEDNLVCYATQSDDERLAFSKYDAFGTYYPDGGVEMVTYPTGSDNPTAWDAERFEQFYYNDSEKALGGSYNKYTVPSEYYEGGLTDAQALASYKSTLGYVPTVPFCSDDAVLRRDGVLYRGDIMCVYVCVWIEGSDLECVDSAIGGYVTLSINFAVA